MIDDAEFGKAFQPRPSERYGGREAVGSALWLEHVEGIKIQNEDGSNTLIKPDDLTQDESKAKGSPYLALKRAMTGDTLLLSKQDWLRRYVLRMLPLKLVGDATQPPVLLNAELIVSWVPQELTVNPGVISQQVTTRDDEGNERDLTKEKAITFGLRLTPEHGAVRDFGYYPGGMDSDYGIGALEVTADAIKMQLHHRIYLEVLKNPPTQPLPPLIAPPQF